MGFYDAFFIHESILSIQPTPSSHVPSLLKVTESSSSPLAVPEGIVKNLPSLPISEEESRKHRRGRYGGKKDQVHLGGFTDIDLEGVSIDVWKFLIGDFGVKSIIDVGCGRGISTLWFFTHGVDALCVEGSRDAVQNSMLPDPASQVIEHDFSRGPWWPQKTYDAVWCVEFLEHVGRNHMKNYLPIFRKAAYIFVTHSTWGGWHHVEVHNDAYWIQKFESYGFVYLDTMTNTTREMARSERIKEIDSVVAQQKYNPQHLIHRLMIFANPLVASLPEHMHLMAKPGCFLKFENNNPVNQKCKPTEEHPDATELPTKYEPLRLTKTMDDAWESIVKSNIRNPRK